MEKQKLKQYTIALAILAIYFMSVWSFMAVRCYQDADCELNAKGSRQIEAPQAGPPMPINKAETP